MIWYITGALVCGGIGTVASRDRELIRRWLTWCCAAALVCGALLSGPPGAAVLASALGAVAAVEYGKLVSARLPDTLVVATAAVALPFVAWLDRPSVPRALACALLLSALVPVLDGDAGGARRSAANVFGAGWLSALTVLVLLHNDEALSLVFAVAMADVGAYVAGRVLRGPFLSPLSPAKRWSGVAGGALAGCGVLALTGSLTVPFMVAVVVGAPAGDLLESMVKRSAGVKDAGTWLPGFGGLLDRIDSLLVVLALGVLL
jgi:phosphatidate cytidylyltransferase